MSMFVNPTINPLIGQLPLVGEDTIVLHHHLLDLIGHGQDLLTILLNIHFNLPDLYTMGPLLLLHVVHLKKCISKANKKPYICFLPCVPVS